MPSARKAALVTGSSGGIGSAMVRWLRERGWQVVAVDRAAKPAAGVRSITADLSRAQEVERVCEVARAHHPRIDALINNAADQLCKSLVQTEPAEWDQVMATNVRSAYALARGLYPQLAAARGAIVNVSSVHAVATSPAMAAYAASKGALIALTRAMALEFAADGVRANAVLPGAIDTPMLRAGLGRGHAGRSQASVASRLDRLARRHPLGRVGRPDDVVEAIAFLADGQRAGFITGQTLIVDGGALAHLSTE